MFCPRITCDSQGNVKAFLTHRLTHRRTESLMCVICKMAFISNIISSFLMAILKYLQVWECVSWYRLLSKMEWQSSGMDFATVPFSAHGRYSCLIMILHNIISFDFRIFVNTLPMACILPVNHRTTKQLFFSLDLLFMKLICTKRL